MLCVYLIRRSFCVLRSSTLCLSPRTLQLQVEIQSSYLAKLRRLYGPDDGGFLAAAFLMLARYRVLQVGWAHFR